MSGRRFKKERHPFANPSASQATRSGIVTSLDPAKALEDGHSKTDSLKERELFKPKNLQPTTRASWDNTWSPSIGTATKLLLSARLCSVVWSHITDCDETFNYWEPLHYLLYKFGFQTWEYSPVNAIRSYAYVLLHGLPLKLYEMIIPTHRFFVFYLLRMFMAIGSVIVDRAFYSSVEKRFGPSVSRTLLVFLMFAPGFFISTTAFLPSSFAMLMTTAAYTAWFSDKNMLAITAIAFGSILGWPFAGALGIPIALDLIRKTGFMEFFKAASGIGGVIACVVIAIDSTCYGKLVFPPLNIILYNIISGHGPELYGIVPWYFYFINGFLNFNISFILSLLCPALILFVFIIGKKCRNSLWDVTSWVYCIGTTAAVAIWLAIFIRTPHKEERFLFPIYGLLALLAAISLELITAIPSIYLVKLVAGRTLSKSINMCILLILVTFSGLSLSRSFALTKNYSAPMEIYRSLQLEADSLTSVQNGINLCVGKEWHRFPSSFFLPSQWRLNFIRSEFHGLLPKPFEKFPRGLSMIPTEMNDENREEATRYVDICQCHYLVDLELDGQATDFEPHYSKEKNTWKIVFDEPFLDAAKSDQMFRAFYLPWFSEQKTQFGHYYLLRRKTPCQKK